MGFYNGASEVVLASYMEVERPFVMGESILLHGLWFWGGVAGGA